MTPSTAPKPMKAAAILLSKFFLKLFAIAIIIRFFIVSVNRIDGDSMSPTLHNGQLTVFNKIVYAFKTPARFEVVEVLDPVNRTNYLIKRIIGLPNETLMINQGSIFISASDTPSGFKKINEPYLKQGTLTGVGTSYGPVTFTTHDHQYIVLGDNRFHSSTDSRFFGPIDRSYILGKLEFTIP